MSSEYSHFCPSKVLFIPCDASQAKNIPWLNILQETILHFTVSDCVTGENRMSSCINRRRKVFIFPLMLQLPGKYWNVIFWQQVKQDGFVVPVCSFSAYCSLPEAHIDIFSPSLNSYITLEWKCNSMFLQHNQVFQVLLVTLSVGYEYDEYWRRAGVNIKSTLWWKSRYLVT